MLMYLKTCLDFEPNFGWKGYRLSPLSGVSKVNSNRCFLFGWQLLLKYADWTPDNAANTTWPSIRPAIYSGAQLLFNDL